eukprot:m.238986 g.238986  ORF g.238986 m.238986 type:complete len:467 (-) comp15813_c1_seq4:208-1608(-)
MMVEEGEHTTETVMLGCACACDIAARATATPNPVLHIVFLPGKTCPVPSSGHSTLQGVTQHPNGATNLSFAHINIPFPFRFTRHFHRGNAALCGPLETMLRALAGFALLAAAGASIRRDYTIRGAIEVDTNENTIFLFQSKLYLIENIPCYYSEHAGIWDPAYANASYARIRDFATGALITNVSSSIGFGFVSAFVDEHPPTGGPPVLWLFGSACNRCPHPKAGPQGCVSPRTVQWWRATDATLTNFTTGVAGGTAPTYNVEVARVTSSPQQQAAVGLPPHNYVMILEIKPTLFLLNNAVDGDLSSGWFPIPGVNNDFGCPSGGPSIRFSPLDQYYYAIEGGTHVELVRTRDFQTWERSPNAPFLEPSEADAQVAPFAGFPAVAAQRLFPPMSGDNWTKWDHNSNDADVCCMTTDPAFATQAYVVYGAGTQGGAPKPPLTKANHCANVVATANMSLPALLARHFEP